MPRRSQPLTHKCTVRLTADEHDRLQALSDATGKNPSEIIRSLLGRAPNLRPASPRKSIWDQRALAELARIGNNINQIARELHTRDRQEVMSAEFAKLDQALLQLVVVTMAGPEAASKLVLEGLTAFMASTSIQRMRGPSEPPERKTP